MSITPELDYTLKQFNNYLVTSDGEHYKLGEVLPPELIDLIDRYGSKAFQALVDDLYLGHTLNLNDTHLQHCQQLLPPDLTTFEAVFPLAISHMGGEDFTKADLLLDNRALPPRWVELKLRANHARCVRHNGDDQDSGEKLYSNVELSCPEQLEKYCLRCRSLKERDQRKCPLLSRGMNTRLAAKMAVADYKAWLLANQNIEEESLVGSGNDISLEPADTPEEFPTSQEGSFDMQNTREEPLVGLRDYISQEVRAAPERIPVLRAPKHFLPDEFDLIGSKGRQGESKIDRKPKETKNDPASLLDAPIVDTHDFHDEIKQFKVTSAVKILQHFLVRIATIDKPFAIKRDIAPPMKKLGVAEQFLYESKAGPSANLVVVLAAFLAGAGRGIHCLKRMGSFPIGKRIVMSGLQQKILTDNAVHFSFLPAAEVNCTGCKWENDCELRRMFYRNTSS